MFHDRRIDAALWIYMVNFVCVSGGEMNGFQNGKNCNLDKPFPGCLGRMVNLFDLNSGVTGNRLLTDKPHRDGETLCNLCLSVSCFCFRWHEFCFCGISTTFLSYECIEH